MTQLAEQWPDSLDSEQLARFCKAAGDPRRLQILRAMARDSFGVLELCRVFAMRQPAMSHHLKVLAEAGLVGKRREGNHIYYRRSHRPDSSALEPLFERLFETLDLLPLTTMQTSRLDAIQRERAGRSEAFFHANAEKFTEQQDLIAAPEQYLEAMLQLIDGLPSAQGGKILELGTGAGWLLPHLAKRAREVVAVDSSAAMLEAARKFCRARKVKTVRFVEGDNRSLAALYTRFDLVIANMVLHHTPSPAVVIRDLANVLAPGGALLISDLGAHDQGWVREACGDLWLGFAAEDLEDWSDNAGLVAGESAFLALRNGFQIQIRTFYLPTAQDGK